MSRLLDTVNKRFLKKGDEVTDFRGDKAKVMGWHPGFHGGSTGRILVKTSEGDREFYPSVFDCAVIQTNAWYCENCNTIHDRMSEPDSCIVCGETNFSEIKEN